MRLLLSTLAILAIAAPAYANDLNNDPENSIKKSNNVSNETSYESSPSRLEPAAGAENVKEYNKETTTTTTSTDRPAHAKKTHSTTVKTESHKRKAGDVQTEAEPTAKTPRTVE